MLGDDIAQALPELQAHAESMMRDAITIKRPTGETTTNPDGEVVAVYELAPVYAGACRVRRRTPTVSEEMGGAETMTTTDLEIHVPVSAGDVFLPGDVGFVRDVATYRVLESHYQTFQTAIRLPAERVR